jgi:hypothetical protein
MMRVFLLATGAALLFGCGEVNQSKTAANTDRGDQKPWQGAQAAYMAPGWKAGNPSEWENQIRTRGQLQNEYPRTQ